MKSRMLFELLEFLLSTNAKVKKMTTVSAVMFEIVEMYISNSFALFFFSVLYVKAKPWFIFFLNLFQNLYTGHFFEKIFPVFVDWF
jgi:fatty acid desaturase